MFQIEKATKLQAKGRIAITGPAGAGKTYTSLLLAQELQGEGRILFLDSEGRSSEKYADEFDFDILPLVAPYSVQTYLEAVKFAGEQEGYSVIIVDSLSHAWAGEGGALEQVDAAKSKYKGNTYIAWRDVTPTQWKMVEAILQNPKHVIACMRTKMEYLMEKDGGKTTVKKVGLAPIQRAGMEYEFDLVLDMDWDHRAIVSKTRMNSIADKVFLKPGKELGQEILAWLSSGEAERPEPIVKKEAETTVDEEPTPEDKGPRDFTQGDLVALARQRYGYGGKEVGAALKVAGFNAFNIEKWDEMVSALENYHNRLDGKVQPEPERLDNYQNGRGVEK